MQDLIARKEGNRRKTEKFTICESYSRKIWPSQTWWKTERQDDTPKSWYWELKARDYYKKRGKGKRCMFTDYKIRRFVSDNCDARDGWRGRWDMTPCKQAIPTYGQPCTKTMNQHYCTLVLSTTKGFWTSTSKVVFGADLVHADGQSFSKETLTSIDVSQLLQKCIDGANQDVYSGSTRTFNPLITATEVMMSRGSREHIFCIHENRI